MNKMTRTAVIPKLLDPNLVYQIHEKITKITHQMTKTRPKE